MTYDQLNNKNNKNWFLQAHATLDSYQKFYEGVMELE